MSKTLLGIVFISVSSILYGVFNPMLKKAGLNAYATLIVQLGFSWLVGLPIFLATGSYKDISMGSVVLIAVAAAIGTVAYILAVKSFALLPMWQIAVFSLIAPLSTAVFSYFILGEPIPSKFFLSLILVGAGLFIAVR